MGALPPLARRLVHQPKTVSIQADGDEKDKVPFAAVGGRLRPKGSSRRLRGEITMNKRVSLKSQHICAILFWWGMERTRLGGQRHGLGSERPRELAHRNIVDLWDNKGFYRATFIFSIAAQVVYLCPGAFGSPKASLMQSAFP